MTDVHQLSIMEKFVKPTTKNLAEAAGVSLATVDRVLNSRPGVMKKNIDKVKQAIDEIGFVRDLFAANLARNREYHFLFILPLSGDHFLDEIHRNIEEINKVMAGERVVVRTIQIDETTPHKLVKLIHELDTDNLHGIAIMAPETPPLRDAIHHLKDRGIHVLAFISNLPSSDCDNFVGIDNMAAGRTAAKLLGSYLHPGVGRIIVIAETMQSRDSLERRLGFDSIINSKFEELSVLPTLETYNDPTRTKKVVTNALKSHPDIRGIYILSSEARIIMNAISKIPQVAKLTKIAHERTAYTQKALEENELDAVITQNTGHLVRSVIRTLRAKSDNRDIVESQEKIRIEILLKENL